ncbi:MAG: F0F1 ATP synthase subunit B [Phycisphaeraceae bacterium]
MLRTRYWLLSATATLAPALAFAQEEPAAHGRSPVDPGQALLSPNLMSAIWNLGMFLVLFAILAKFVWPAILSALQAREDKIRGDLRQAESANKQARQTLVEYQKQLAEAHAESRRMLEQTRADADQLRAKLAAETEEELARTRQLAREEIDRAKQAAVQDLYVVAADLATAVAGKILQRQVTDPDTARLVDQSMQELKTRKAS